MDNEKVTEILKTLENRFKKNMSRHPNIKWEDVKTKIEQSPKKAKTLFEMENTGGEPDVVGYDKGKDEYIIYDCSPESPKERRNLCYDREALISRKSFKPKDSAIDMANNIGVEILNEEQYRELQSLGEFDQKTSSWILTPNIIRELGGAIFADRRYNTVFIFHNGADSYYSSRGFRGCLRV